MKMQDGTRPEAMEDLEIREAADRLLSQTRRSTLMTLEAAMARARPYRPGRRSGDDALDAAHDMMTLSRLALRSADRLNSVAGALIGCDLRSWDHGTGPRH
ncbi:hypothetical protein [Caenispirillum salinarum]|uniref:hypothetical protein n=1 Tax=Caenispirillum salinarum TaxID=859058 RepID=UPI00384BC7AD